MSRFNKQARRTSTNLLRAAVLATPVVLAIANATQGANVYWDISGATGGAGGTTPSGSWNSSTSNWSTDSTGAAVTAGWTNGDTAVFAAAADATGSYTVTASGTQTVGGMNFEEGTITITGGTLALSGPQTWLFNTASNRTVTINSTISGAVGATGLTISNNANFTDTLNLGGNNSGLTGKIFISVSAAASSNVIDVIPSTDTALGASGAGNEIEFTDPSGGTLGRVTLTGGRNINKNIVLRGGGNGQGGHGNIRSSAGVNTWSGNISLDSAGSGSGNNLSGISVLAGSTLVATGIISPATGTKYLGKVDPGTLVLYPQAVGAQTTNSYNGGTRLLGGTIEVMGNRVLGTTVGDDAFSSTVYVGAFGGQGSTTLAFRAPPTGPNAAGFNYSDDKQIFLTTNTGATADQISAVANYGGNNSFGGDIIFGAAPQLVVDIAAGSLQVNGGLWANVASANRTINKNGPGELILTRNNNATNGVITTLTIGAQFALTNGVFNLNAGQLTLRGAGTLSGGIGISISPLTTLKLDNTTQAVDNRINTTAALPLTAANIVLLGNASASTSQTVDSIALNGGMSDITVSQPTSGNGSTTTLNVTNALSRPGRATALLRGLDGTTSLMNAGSISPGGSMLGGGGSGSQINILPWVAATAVDNSTSDFITVGNGSGVGAVRPLTAGEYITLASGNAGRDNATASPAANGAGNHLTAALTQVNALKLNGGSTISIDSGKRLWVYSGGLLGVGTASSTITGGNLAFEEYYPVGDPQTQAVGAYDKDPFSYTDAVGISDGAKSGASVEAIVTVPTGSTLVQASDNVISGAAGLTKSGGGTLRLQGNNTFGRNPRSFYYYDGSNAVQVDPQSAQPLTINAGRVEFSSDLNLGNTASAVVINGGTLAPIASSTSTRSITLASLAPNTIDVGSGATLTSSGLVTGNALTKTGAGTLELTNTLNSYAGGTLINDGYMELNASDTAQKQFGTGAVTLNGGSVRADVDMVLNRSLVTTATNSTGGFYVAAGKTLTFGGGAAQTVGISGTGNLGLDGGGTLIMAKIVGTQNTYVGDFYVRGGSTLTYEENGAGNLQAGLGGTPPSLRQNYWNLSGGSTLRFNNITATAGFSNSNLGITIGSGGGTIDTTTAATVIQSFGGLYGAGALTKKGPGEFSMRARDSVGNTSFTGTFILNEGLLTSSTQSNNFDAGAMFGTGPASFNPTWMQIAGGAELEHLFGTGNLTFSSNRGITLTSGVPIFGLGGGGASNFARFNGVIAGTSNTGVQIDVRNSGSIIFGAANTYAGDTIIKSVPAGGSTNTLRMGATNALPSTTTVHFDARTATGSAILDLAVNTSTTGFSQSIVTLVNDNPGVGTVRVTNSGNAAATLNLTTNSAINWADQVTGNNMFLGHSGAGDLVLTNASNSFGGVDGTGNTVVGDGATGITNTIGRVRQGNLNIRDNSKVKAIGVANLSDATQSAAQTSKVATLTLGANAKWDLNNAKAIITADPIGTWNGSDYTGTTGLVKAGRNGGTWDGARGIITSQSNALPAQSSITTLAVALASDTGKTTFGGQALTGTETLVMYTWTGDANLSGKIDADDYFQIDSNYNKSGSSFGFNKGDFNYDGQINGDDYFLIDAAYVGQGSTVISSASGVGSGELGGVSAVPEPASLSIVGMGLALAARRRRRH